VTSKKKYYEFCLERDIALYQNDWWLDAVCDGKWDVMFREEKGAVTSAWAYPFKKKYGLKLITMPMLTLGLGPVFEPESQDKSPGELPSFDLFDLYFLPGSQIDFSNWKGFKQTTRYTYRLPDISDTEKVFKKFSSSTRQQIRKAEKNVTVHESDDIGLLYKMVSHTFKRQSKKTPYSLPFVKRIDETCKKHSCRKILVAKDSQGNFHGSCFIAWDKRTAYYVMGGSDPAFKSSAAYSLLLWEAIREASKHAKEFDFCGSSIPSIERFFRGFGGEKISYLHLKKVNSKALKLVLSLKGK
jgi:hypothetical protein